MTTRWERLHFDLLAADVPARLDHRAGRTSIFVKNGAGCIEISDAQWRKNTDIWVGWHGAVSNQNGIVTAPLSPTRRRTDVVSFVTNHYRRIAP